MNVQQRKYGEALAKIRLVTSKLMDLKPTDVKWQSNNRSKGSMEKEGFYPRDYGMTEWDWPQGIGIFGLSRMPGNKNETYIKKWAADRITEGLPSENVNTTVPLLTLCDYPEYEDLSLEWMTDIEANFIRTNENVIQHVTTGESKNSIRENKNQIWVDTTFMTLLFVAKMANKFEREDWEDDANYQILEHIKYLLDRKTGLFYHGWNFSSKSNYGGIFWCRGNSWMTYGIPLFLELNPAIHGTALAKYLAKIYSNQVKALFELRDASGLWHTILTDKSSYIETSGSAAIIAGVYLGLNAGLIDKKIYEEECDQSFDALLERVNVNGAVSGVSAGTAISSKIDDYKKIKQLPMAYGQALVLCAMAEFLQEKDSQIEN